jgi:dynein heavy chain
VKAPEVDYAALLESLDRVLKEHNLQTSPYLISKIIQIYDMILVRHGLMVVGLPFSGKTTAISMLAKSLTVCSKEQSMI